MGQRYWLGGLLAVLATACGQSPAGDPGGAFMGPKGIGPDSKWKDGVAAHVAEPYQACGEIGTGELSWAAASPSAATEIAVASSAGLVLFFSSDDGSSLRSRFDAGWPVSSVDYSRDGRQLVVAGEGGVKILNLADGSVAASSKPFDYETTAAALSPDGSLLAVVGTDSPPEDEQVVLRLIRVADGTRLAELAHRDGRPFVAPQFSPDGKAVLVGTTFASVPDLQIIFFPPRGNYRETTALSPDGTLLAGSGHVWNIASGLEVKPSETVSAPPMWLAFSPDGMTYAEAIFDRAGFSIHLYRTDNWSEVALPTTDHGQPLPTEVPDGRFFFTRDGKRLILMLDVNKAAQASADPPVLRIVNFPDLTTQTVIARPGLSLGGPATFSPDGSLIATRLETTSAVWRAADLAPLSRFGKAWPLPYRFLSNGMLSAEAEQIYDPKTGQLIGDEPISWEGISPDGTQAVAETGLVSRRLDVVRLSDLSTISSLEGSPEGYGVEWAFSPDNRYVAATYEVNDTHTLRVFDAATGKLAATLPGTSPFAFGLSNGAVRLVGTTTDTSRVRVWSIPDGATLLDLDDAGAVAFSPEGSLIAVGNDVIRVYHSDTGALRESFFAHGSGAIHAYPSRVALVAFSATGQLVSVGGQDRTLRLWCSP